MAREREGSVPLMHQPTFASVKFEAEEAQDPP